MEKQIDLQTASRKADELFTRWRALWREYAYHRVSLETLEDAIAQYKIAEHIRQDARKAAGLPYIERIDLSEQTPEHEECCICHKDLEYMDQRYRNQGKVYCPYCAFDLL